jgi:hypothetical protein
VGNYPPVTVENKSGFCRSGKAEIEVVDLPGTYSLAPFYRTLTGSSKSGCNCGDGNASCGRAKHRHHSPVVMIEGLRS